jgi:anti-sigma B factor antagonist
MAAEREPSSTVDEHGPASFRVATDEGATVIHVTGELDAASGTHLRSLLADGFEARATAVAVDLAGITFVDSVGLSVLVTGHNRAQAEGVAFEVRNVPATCMKVFEITRLDEVLSLR